MNVYRFCLTVFFIVLSGSLNAQNSTFESVVNIFSENCANAYCHGAGAGDLTFTGSIDEIYESLINVSPSNLTASEKGNKLIVPGDPTASFLYRKINDNLYSFDDLHDDEGTNMPPTGSLSNVDKEIIRQWILWGAPKEGIIHDEALLTEFYVDGNALDRISPLEPPAEGEGFQVHLGTLFLEPNEETEVMKMVEIPLGDSLEIIGFEVKMNDFSHHYGVARALNGFENEIPPGFNVVDNFLTSYDFFNNSEYITGSQLPSNNYQLPENTAFRWDGSNVLNFNYHIKNYSSTAILPAEGYVNLYVQPRNTAEKVMRTSTITYEPDGNVFALQILPNAQDTTFTMEYFIEGSEEYIDVWRLNPHTHAYGVDYDIFLRNEDGSKGEQVYEGFYNYDFDYNQGYYDYSHASHRSFDEALRIKLSEGLIFEATYNNPGTETVGFGLTTDDEMFVGYFVYTNVDSTDLVNTSTYMLDNENVVSADFYPNPVEDRLTIQIENLSVNAELNIYDLSGKNIFNKKIEAGTMNEVINLDELMNGTYIIELGSNKEILYSQKIIKQ